MGDFKGGFYKPVIDLGFVRVMGAPVSQTPRRERAEKLNLKPMQA